MKKLPLILALVAALSLSIPALAVPGLDPPSVPSTYQVIFMQKTGGTPLNFFTANLARSAFDFGDREGYNCAFIELMQGTRVDAVVTFERIDLQQANGEDYLMVNDKGGLETSDGHSSGPGAVITAGTCGVDLPPGEGKGSATFDGSDHFPHLVHAGDRLQFYRFDAPSSSLSLRMGECSKSYLTPGDEAGEAWLWWDDDGPTGSHNHETNDLNCGGGPEEPFAIARVYVQYLRPGVGLTYCTETAHETLCA